MLVVRYMYLTSPRRSCGLELLLADAPQNPNAMVITRSVMRPALADASARANAPELTANGKRAVAAGNTAFAGNAEPVCKVSVRLDEIPPQGPIFYTLHVESGDQISTWKVLRRYSDFEALRALSNFPPLPQKHGVRRVEQALQERAAALEEWTNQVLQAGGTLLLYNFLELQNMLRRSRKIYTNAAVRDRLEAAALRLQAAERGRAGRNRALQLRIAQASLQMHLTNQFNKHEYRRLEARRAARAAMAIQAACRRFAVSRRVRARQLSRRSGAHPPARPSMWQRLTWAGLVLDL